MPPPKKARMSTLTNQSKTWMVKKKAAVSFEMIAPSLPSTTFTTADRHPAKSIRAQLRLLQEQQVAMNVTLRGFQNLLQIQETKIQHQESMLAAQTSALEGMSKRVLDLEQALASKACCAKNKQFEDASTEDPVPQSPMANNLSFQSLQATNFKLTLTSTPIQASPNRIETPTQTSPSCTPTQESTLQDDPVPTPTPDITLRTLPSDREETFYRHSLVRGQHHPDVYAASVFMSIVPFKTYNCWVKKCNWAGTNGKMALPENVKERVHSLVSQRFPNLSVDQWHKVRSRINERLRCPRKVDPETARHGFVQH